jgi:exonuclease SbcD
VYAGSLDRIDFSEEKDSKGWELIDIQGGSTTHDFCVNVMSRHLLTLEINVLGDDSPMPKIISEIKEYDEIDGTIVRMIIECDSELFIDKNQISQLLDDMGMYELHSIQLTVPREYHSRLDSDKPASAYTVMEMMDIYFEELEDDEWDEVIELAEEIMGEVIDD